MIRYRKKVEKDEAYIASSRRARAGWRTWCAKTTPWTSTRSTSPGRRRTTTRAAVRQDPTVFRDPCRCFLNGYINWNPDVENRKCAVAYSILHFQKQPEGTFVVVHLGRQRAERAGFRAEGPSQLCCVNYNPKDTNVLSGHVQRPIGTGTCARATAVDTSPIEKSHRGPCYDMDGCRQNGHGCFSIHRRDGFWWDTRRLAEPWSCGWWRSRIRTWCWARFPGVRIHRGPYEVHDRHGAGHGADV